MKQDNLKKLFGDLDDPVQEKSIKVTNGGTLDETVKELCRIYEHVADTRDDNPDFTYKLCKRNLPRDKYKISNQVITQLSTQIFMYDADIDFKETAGPFLTAAIQTAFLQGHNNFDILFSGATPMHYFGRDLHGWPANKLRMNVMDSGCSAQSAGWFSYAQNLDVKITGMQLVPSPHAQVQIFGQFGQVRYFTKPDDFAVSTKRCRFGVDNKDVFYYLTERFKLQENLRSVGQPYVPMPESERSEAYLLDRPEPEVIVLDLDKAIKPEFARLAV
ncbi:MAG: hypothetical protein HY438_01965 [DPANN group archaeon]|nr:hypothetical protein [DPANN group archaeon]